MRNKLRIIPWNEQTFQKDGRTYPSYAVVYSTHAWCKTPEQKRESKKK